MFLIPFARQGSCHSLDRNAKVLKISLRDFDLTGNLLGQDGFTTFPTSVRCLI